MGVSKTKVTYSLGSSCPLRPAGIDISINNLKLNTGSSFKVKFHTSNIITCILSPLELLSVALDAGKKLVSLGDKLVTGISADTWKGLSDTAGGVIRSSTVKSVIGSYGSATNAATQLADKGKKAAKKLSKGIKKLFGKKKKRVRPRYKDEPGKCKNGDDWSIEYARCWRRGHELVRMKDNPNLCLAIRKRIREKGKAIEVWVCDGGWHQQWKWHTQGAGLYGYVSDGYQGDWCLDREG